MNKKKYFLMAIGVAGLVATFILGMYSMNYQTINFQKNMIGKLYRQESVTAKDYVYSIFEEPSETYVSEADDILREYGFSKQGTFYMEKAMGLLKSHFLFFLIEFLFLGLLLLGCFRYEKSRRREKEALLERIRELEQAQREDEYLEKQNKRIQNFIENVAHQIKTPISRVSSSLYMIEDRLEHTETKMRIEECYSHLESVNGLMKRLTDIGRLEAGKIIFKKEKIYMDELLMDVIRSSGAEQERIRTKFDYAQGLEYYGDYEWLKEAFLNILKNGLEHDKTDKPLEIICTKDEDGIKITIRDHGEGLKEQDIPNLFDRFYTPESVKANHTGIGLNLAKLIFDGHFGTVYVFNSVEGGAVFQIRLPQYALKTGKS